MIADTVDEWCRFTIPGIHSKQHLLHHNLANHHQIIVGMTSHVYDYHRQCDSLVLWSTLKYGNFPTLQL